MKVSKAKIKLTEKDLIGIADDFLEVEGLTIETVEINEVIKINGNYRNKINIPFKAEIGIGRAKNNIVTVKLFKIHIYKVWAFKELAKLTLKALLKKFDGFGVEIEKDYLHIDLNVLSKFIPFVYFMVDEIHVNEGEIEVYAENILYAKDKPTEIISVSKTIKAHEEKVNKIVDLYSCIREKVSNKIPNKYKSLSEYILMIPDIVVLFGRLMNDKRVDKKTKLLIGGAIAYLISPINLVFESIPIIGEIDDISIIFFVLEKTVQDVPSNIISENWQGKNDILLKSKEGIRLIISIIGKNNIKHIFKFLNRRRKS
jgi:uncharacterized membrane protein YkvA (DUF1232 family)